MSSLLLYIPKEGSCLCWREMIKVRDESGDMPKGDCYNIQPSYDWLQGEIKESCPDGRIGSGTSTLPLYFELFSGYSWEGDCKLAAV
ncbi:unnamed protein product [Cuscuta campestris]|uniref:Uncharacterized protein n=1 Tax=Cuscuta campestris TaxID=132261 RepID=A0A484KZ95_9ASTE|nr:unnamed protein product [Cuscuta campestris]